MASLKSKHLGDSDEMCLSESKMLLLSYSYQKAVFKTNLHNAWHISFLELCDKVPQTPWSKAAEIYSLNCFGIQKSEIKALAGPYS